jgi:hypothetical protein
MTAEEFQRMSQQLDEWFAADISLALGMSGLLEHAYPRYALEHLNWVLTLACWQYGDRNGLPDMLRTYQPPLPVSIVLADILQGKTKKRRRGKFKLQGRDRAYAAWVLWTAREARRLLVSNPDQWGDLMGCTSIEAVAQISDWSNDIERIVEAKFDLNDKAIKKLRAEADEFLRVFERIPEEYQALLAGLTAPHQTARLYP